MPEIKRPNYFNSQFLQEKDFQDEQTYHIKMRRLLNQRLHNWGIAAGLEVQRVSNSEISVTPGMAIDRDGREIFLSNDPPPTNYNLSSFTGNAVVFLTISYDEVFDNSDRNPTGATDKFVRTTERPKREAKTDVPPTDGSVMILAKVTLENGIISDRSIDLSVRSRPVTAVVSPTSINTNQIVDGAVTTAKIADATIIAAKLVEGLIGTSKLADNAVVTSKIADNAINAAKILDGSVGAAELANNAVTVDKILNAAITAAKIAPGVIPPNIGIAIASNLANGATVPPPTGFLVTECVFFAFAKALNIPVGGGSFTVFADNTGKITATFPANGGISVVAVAIAKKGGW
jgi:hypothetical protein